MTSIINSEKAFDNIQYLLLIKSHQNKITGELSQNYLQKESTKNLQQT